MTETVPPGASRPPPGPATSAGTAAPRAEKTRDQRARFADPAVARRNLYLLGFMVVILYSGVLPSLQGPLERLWRAVQLARSWGYDRTLRAHRSWFPAVDPPTVCVIAIDDYALQRYGRWPWRRNVVANLIRKLDRLGARTIALDMLLAEPDPSFRQNLSSLAGEIDDPALSRLLADSEVSLEALRTAAAEDRLSGSEPARKLRILLEREGPDGELEAAIREAGNVILGSILQFRGSRDQGSSWLNPEEGQLIPRNAADFLTLRGVVRGTAELDELWRHSMLGDAFLQAGGVTTVPLGMVSGIDTIQLAESREDRAAQRVVTRARQAFLQGLRTLAFRSQVVEGLHVPLGRLAAAAAGVGYMNDDVEEDAVVRTISMAKAFDNHLVASLSFAAVAHSLGGRPEAIGSVLRGDLKGTDLEEQPVVVLSGIGVGERNASGRRAIDAFPCDDAAAFFLNYYWQDNDIRGRRVPVWRILETPWGEDGCLPLPSAADLEREGRRYGADRPRVVAELFPGDPAPNEAQLAARCRYPRKVSFDEVRRPPLVTISAGDILDLPDVAGNEPLQSQLGPEEIRQIADRIHGRIAFVGVTSAGLTDLRVTPLGEIRPGVEAHATAAANLLSGGTLQFRGEESRLVIAIQFAMVMALSLLLIRLDAFKGLLVTGVFCLVSWLVGVAFLHLGSVINPIDLIVPLLGLYAVGMAYLNMFENREKAWIDDMFKRYVSPAYVEQLKRNKGRLELTGRESVITPFFSDMAKFSTISESFTAEGLFRFLGEYLGEMADLLDRFGGTLDKFEGDAVVAFFGAPIADPNHAVNACLCSLAMQERVKELEKDWQESGRYPELLEMAKRRGSWFPIQVRIGLHTGRCATGHLGTAERGNYTMMGDTVNLASRLEGAGKQYGISLTVSEATWEAARHAVRGREIDLIRVVGKTVPTRIYEVLGRLDQPNPELDVFLHMYEDALASYRQRRFGEALERFRNAERRRPGDRPTAIYLGRCEEFVHKPPPEDWDGVAVMTEK